MFLNEPLPVSKWAYFFEKTIDRDNTVIKI